MHELQYFLDGVLFVIIILNIVMLIRLRTSTKELKELEANKLRKREQDYKWWINILKRERANRFPNNITNKGE